MHKIGNFRILYIKLRNLENQKLQFSIIDLSI